MILALAAGVLMSNGETARLEVRHEGAPIPVEIVGLDAQDREVPVTAIPSRLRVGHGRPRTVRVQFPSTVVALCAAYSSPSVRVLSCSQELNLREQTQSQTQTGSAPGGFLSTLRRAVAATQQGQTAPPSQLPVVQVTIPSSAPSSASPSVALP